MSETQTIVPPAPAQSVLGVDLSICQGVVSGKMLAAAGLEFVIAKATQGESYADPSFDRNIGEAAANGLERSAYHWLSSGGDVGKQVANFYNHIRGRLSFAWAVDFEEQAGRGGAWLAKCETFVKSLQDLTGNRGMLYTGKWYWLSNVAQDSDVLAAMPLWHAEYPSLKRGGATHADYAAAVAALPTDGPHIAPPWESRGLGASLWQFDGDKGLVLPNGIDADFDLWLGSRAEWTSFLKDPQPRRLLPKVWVPTVKNVQQLLLDLGGYDLAPYGADGTVGPKTLTAIKAYQGAHGLGADGVVGPATTKAMLEDWQRLHPIAA